MTRKLDHEDLLFGEKVPDPYRWLEDGESDEVRAWTQAKNEQTLAYLAKVPSTERLRKRVHDLLTIGFAQSPTVRVGKDGKRRYFHTRREGEDVQPALLVRDGHDGKDRVLIDVAKLSADGTDALDWWYPSQDGSLVAWGRSEQGSEESTLYVLDVETGDDLGVRIPHTRYASVAWVSARRFFYTRHPAKGDVPEGDEQYFARIYEHEMGRDPSLDPCVFGEGRDKTDAPSVLASPDGRWIVARVHQGWERSEVYARESAGGPWIPVAAGQDALFDPIVRDDALYLLTNAGAPRYKLVRASWSALTSPAEVLEEKEDVLTSVAIVPEGVVAAYLRDASSRVLVFDATGRFRQEIELPALGSADVSAPPQGGEAFVDFTSFVIPFESLRLDLSRAPLELRVWDRVAGAPPEGIAVTRFFAESKDGTRVPVFVVAKPGGPRPTVLYGYGGFNVNMTPAFSARALAFVEQGGVWANAVLRGGGEYGEAWHRAGMLQNKPRVFEDYFACAEALVANGTTAPGKLAAMGGSNGGLLVAAAVTGRPELFRAGVALVPLTDMLRFHRFRLGAFWVPEYGSPDDEAHFRFLYEYSPYHRVKEGVRYPSMLFTSAESDTRVDPLHARKMAARMAEVEKDRPILLFVESRAGHGQGKPTHKLEEDLVMQLGFVFQELGMTSADEAGKIAPLGP